VKAARLVVAWLPAVLYPAFLGAGFASVRTPACNEMQFHAPAGTSLVSLLCLGLLLEYLVTLLRRRHAPRSMNTAVCLLAALGLLAGCFGAVLSVNCDVLEAHWPTLPADFGFFVPNGWKAHGALGLLTGCATALVVRFNGLHRVPQAS
jgi:hypothetical protein